MLDETTPNQEADLTSADPGLTRKLFITKVVKGAALTGGLAVAPKVLDKFLVQSVAACTPPSSNCINPAGATVAPGSTDTTVNSSCTDTGPFPIPDQTTVTGAATGGGDTLSCCGDNGIISTNVGAGDTINCAGA